MRPQGSAPFTASPPIRFENEDWKCSAEEVQSACFLPLLLSQGQNFKD